MEPLNPIHLFKSLSYLDILNLEEKHVGATNTNLFKNDVFIDLSQVRFAELSAITRLTIQIEQLSLEKNKIFIALPTVVYTEKELLSSKRDSELIKNILNARIKTNNFIKTVGFVNAVRKIATIYENEIYITEEYNFEEKFNLREFQDAFATIFEIKSTEFNNYRYILPIEIIDVTDGLKDLPHIENRIDKILENPQRGLEPLDVQGIKNVILSELIKNVREHSGANHAIFSIGLISTNSLLRQSKTREINPVEKSYFEWLNKDKIQSQVEIYFGDCGKGIFTKEFEAKFLAETESKTREKAKILSWAFSKWSTLKNNEFRRGTKGLYRIQRIVNKYNGIIHITSSNIDGGYRKGGLAEPKWQSRTLRYEESGTFIQIKMCPYSEIKEFKYTLEKNKSKIVWKTLKYLPSEDAEFLDKLKMELKQELNFLVILNVKNLNDDEAKAELEKCLPEISFLAHPSIVVIYLLSNLKNDTIQTIIESSNEFIITITGNEVIQEVAHWNNDQVYDPVLVIAEDNQAFWYGGNQDLINILNESYRADNEQTKLSNLKSFSQLPEDIKLKIKLHIENDIKLINIDENETLTFNFTNIDVFFKNAIGAKLVESQTKSEKICTPKLEIISEWLDVEELIKDNIYGYALTLYLKFKKEIESVSRIDRINLSDTFLLIDNKRQRELAKAFATLFGIHHKNIKIASEDINPNIPRRTKLFPEKASVIILTTIISSSETVRRLVKFVRRDSAIPLGILSLCNYRKYNITNLETWDETTKITSIYQKNEVECEKPARNADYFILKKRTLLEDFNFKGPKLFAEPKLSNNELSLSVSQELRTHIIQTKSLHYNHIGIFKDRHFTFYLDKIKLLNNSSIIWGKIKTSIVCWQKENSIPNFVIHIRSSLIAGYTKNNAFYGFLLTLTKHVIIDEEYPTLIDPNIVFLDFGLISGKTVNELITGCNNVANLFVCIIFDHSKNNDNELYKKIKILKNENTLSNRTTTFSIDYLFKLPLGYFNSENCPICEHTRALDYFKINLA